MKKYLTGTKIKKCKLTETKIRKINLQRPILLTKKRHRTLKENSKQELNLKNH